MRDRLWKAAGAGGGEEGAREGDEGGGGEDAALDDVLFVSHIILTLV